MHGIVTGTRKTKVCPECGQELFADMDVCFGCMHEFSGKCRMRVVTPQVECTVEVPERGLVVGRGSMCDVVVHDRSVSRQHVRIVPDASGIEVQDLGSTNTPVVRGRSLNGTAHLDPGEELMIRDVSLSPVMPE